MTGDTPYSTKSAIVLDDNPQMRGILRSILNAMGLRSVTEFSDASQARNHLQGQHVDVAVLDLVLGGDMNGLDLTLAIRHDPMIVNPMMPIILVTGYANAGVIQQAINAGIDELVTKPLRARDLIARVEKAILNPRSYIRTPSGYFGPDRRRRADPFYAGPERRHHDLADTVGAGRQRKAIEQLRPDPIIEQRSVDETVFVLD